MWSAFAVCIISLSWSPSVAFVAKSAKSMTPAGSTSRLFSEQAPSESVEDAEKRRMEMVRSLQKSFYQSTEEDDETAPRPELQKDTGIMTNVPLWRVGWVETPGRANCLNVHEGQYTHMFETILSRPKPWYVGHLHLPGGFKMARTDEERYELKTWKDEVDDEKRFQETERSAVVGSLMRITDYRRLEDGRLILLVHAMERFVVDQVVQHYPYSISHVQLLPDTEALPEGADENFCKIARAAAVAESFQYHDYEYDHVMLPLPEEADFLPAEGIPATEISKVLPFAFYSSDCSSLDSIEEKSPVESSSFHGGQPPLESALRGGAILSDPPFIPGPDSVNRRSMDLNTIETLLWLALDDFCQSTGFVLPEEILCLMPPDLDYLDMDPPKQRLSAKYPALRRQQRLSYVAPAILENLEIGAGMRQAWLNTPSTKSRLAAVLERFELIVGGLMGKFQ